MQAEAPMVRSVDASALTNAPRKPFIRAAKMAATGAFGGVAIWLAYFVLPSLSRAGLWGYAAAFLVVGTSSSAVFVPVPGFLVLAVMAPDMNPFGLAAAGAVGGALGELTGYWLGRQGRGPIQKMRVGRWVHRQVERRGPKVVPLVGLLPILPMSGSGMVAGLAHYPVRRFFGAILVGKMLMLLTVLMVLRGTFALLGW